jgi:hypothetical protein
MGIRYHRTSSYRMKQFACTKTKSKRQAWAVPMLWISSLLGFNPLETGTFNFSIRIMTIRPRHHVAGISKVGVL